MEILLDKINELKIPEKIKEDIISFTSELKNQYKDSLLSIYMYGMATKNEFIEGVTSINLLVIVKELDIIQIEKIASKANQYKTKSSIIPRFVTEKNVLTGLDVFAIDYYEIQKEGINIFGKNVLEGEKILEKDLIWQLERDTKAMRMKLIQSFWRNVEQPKILRNALYINLRQLIKLLRVALDIKKINYTNRNDVAEKGATAFGYNKETLIEIINKRDTKDKLTKDQIIKLVKNLFQVIAKMDDYFDKWNK